MGGGRKGGSMANGVEKYGKGSMKMEYGRRKKKIHEIRTSKKKQGKGGKKTEERRWIKKHRTREEE